MNRRGNPMNRKGKSMKIERRGFLAIPVRLLSLLPISTVTRIITPVLALTLAAQVMPHLYAQAGDQHAVFAMTNSVLGNQIIAYSRAADGSLVERNLYATGGRGSGGTIDPLGSQGSLTLSQDRSLLFAVNAGTGDLSVFRVRGATLDLVQVASSGGSAPVAIAQYGNLVYVINFAGNS
jgi:6-phosphogluconolactonase